MEFELWLAYGFLGFVGFVETTQDAVEALQHLYKCPTCGDITEIWYEISCESDLSCGKCGHELEPYYKI